MPKRFTVGLNCAEQRIITGYSSRAFRDGKLARRLASNSAASAVPELAVRLLVHYSHSEYQPSFVAQIVDHHHGKTLLFYLDFSVLPRRCQTPFHSSQLWRVL